MHPAELAWADQRAAAVRDEFARRLRMCNWLTAGALLLVWWQSR